MYLNTASASVIRLPDLFITPGAFTHSTLSPPWFTCLVTELSINLSGVLGPDKEVPPVETWLTISITSPKVLFLPLKAALDAGLDNLSLTGIKSIYSGRLFTTLLVSAWDKFVVFAILLDILKTSSTGIFEFLMIELKVLFTFTSSI